MCTWIVKNGVKLEIIGAPRESSEHDRMEAVGKRHRTKNQIMNHSYRLKGFNKVPDVLRVHANVYVR